MLNGTWVGAVCCNSSEELAARELMRIARSRVSPTDPDRLLEQSTKAVPEAALNVEISDRLGLAAVHEPVSGSRSLFEFPDSPLPGG